MVLRSPVDENAFFKIDRDDYFKNLLSTTTMRKKARMASTWPLCDAPDTKMKGLPDYIDLGKLPKCHKDAMSRPDVAEWAEAYEKEYMGIKQL